MSLNILTGATCCLKSTAVKYMNENLLGNQIIHTHPSDSFIMSELRRSGIMTWDFIPRICCKYAEIRMIQPLGNDIHIVERSMLDQYVFALINKDGWFEIEDLLDTDDTLDHEDVILNLEKQLDIDKYMIIRLKSDEFINNIVSDPNFWDSKRCDTFGSMEQYYKLQDMFIDNYKYCLNKIGRLDRLYEIHICDTTADPTEIACKIIDGVKRIIN